MVKERRIAHLKLPFGIATHFLEFAISSRSTCGISRQCVLPSKFNLLLGIDLPH
jgi:hypothetical protein